MTATNQPSADADRPAGADRVNHKPDCRRAGQQYRTRPGDSDRIIIICRHCGARAAVPDAGPARPSRATITPADDGPAAVVVAARPDAEPWPVAEPPAVINLAITTYWCAVHPDVVVSWRGTCTDCADERAERARSRRSRRAESAALQAGGSLR